MNTPQAYTMQAHDACPCGGACCPLCSVKVSLDVTCDEPSLHVDSARHLRLVPTPPPPARQP